jgi:hypothetical protein
LGGIRCQYSSAASAVLKRTPGANPRNARNAERRRPSRNLKRRIDSGGVLYWKTID